MISENYRLYSGLSMKKVPHPCRRQQWHRKSWANQRPHIDKRLSAASDPGCSCRGACIHSWLATWSSQHLTVLTSGTISLFWILFLTFIPQKKRKKHLWKYTNILLAFWN